MRAFSTAAAIVFTISMAGAAGAQDFSFGGGARHPFYGGGANAGAASSGLLGNLYVGIGGQASRISGGELTAARPCSTDILQYFDCSPDGGPAGPGTFATFGSEWGGGFRVELGTRVRAVRLFTLFQGNYWSDINATAQNGLPGTAATIRASQHAYTWTFGAGLDSAVLFPNLLPPAWNIGIQGSIGPSWNTLGNLRSTIVDGGVTTQTNTRNGGTRVAFAGEVGVFLQYALTSSMAVQVGYASKWLGRFETEPSVEDVVSGGVVQPSEFVDSVRTSTRRADEIYAQITIRLQDLLRR